MKRGYVDDPNLRFVDLGGERRAMTREELAGTVSLPDGARPYRHNPITNQRPAQGTDVRAYEFQGRTFTPGLGTFRTDLGGLRRIEQANRLAIFGSGLSFTRFLSDFPFQPISDVWDDTRSGGFGDDKIYVVQTNSKVICAFR